MRDFFKILKLDLANKYFFLYIPIEFDKDKLVKDLIWFIQNNINWEKIILYFWFS